MFAWFENNSQINTAANSHRFAKSRHFWKEWAWLLDTQRAKLYQSMLKCLVKLELGVGKLVTSWIHTMVPYKSRWSCDVTNQQCWKEVMSSDWYKDWICNRYVYVHYSESIQIQKSNSQSSVCAYLFVYMCITLIPNKNITHTQLPVTALRTGHI